MFDWRREVVSCDPEYYRWTQWFFLQLFLTGLAYRKKAAVDWCPSCNTTLAREQVIGDDRLCERCGTPVIRKELEQWFFRITNYADELLDFSEIDWPERVQTLQSTGSAAAKARTSPSRPSRGEPLEVFTTRPDTLWGATFMVLAPEHPLVETLTTPGPQGRGGRLRRAGACARPTSSARPRTRRRPASSPAATRSTRSTASASRSGSPTTC